MAKTKISEFSATPGNNTEIDGINISEGCAPSGINDAIRELMSQLKDFQAGTAGDSFNGPVGTTTAAAGAFTTLSASSTVSGTGFSTYLASPPAIGGTAAAAGSFTTLSASSTVSGTGFSTYLASPPAIGGTTAAAGSFTTLSASSTLSVTGAGSIQGLTVGRGAGAVSTNTAVGNSALASNVSGLRNTFVGYTAGRYTTGSYNVGVGNEALNANTSGAQNTALGDVSLVSNTTGSNNTAVGWGVMLNNLTGASNTGLGAQALYLNTTGTNNIALGLQALYSNTTASNNTAVGYQAGYSNTTGQYNTILGMTAGYSNTASSNSTFIGQAAGYATTGANNQFFGTGAGSAVTTGSKNSILGQYSGNQGGLDIRTANGYIVLSDGDGNPRLHFDGTTWYAFTLAAGAGTNALKFNTTTGAITYDTSSARYKNNIRDSIYGLSHVMQMRSTQFEYKDTGRSDVGLIAEELDPIVPELVIKNKDGQPDSVSYDRMVSVLVKAIQELKAEVDSLKSQLKGA